MELLLLRGAYASHPLLARVLLLFALFMLAQWLLTRRRAAADAALRRQGRRDLALALAALGAALVLTLSGFQGPVTRRSQLETAASAPGRVSYGDPAAAPTIRVFTARGCGPCRQLEGELGPIIRDGYAVQYIPGSLDDQDWDLVTAAICKTGNGAGFEPAFGMVPDARTPVTAAQCDGDPRGNEAVLRRLSGHLLFPTLVMPDGFMITGAPSQDYLRRYLRAAAPLPGKAS